MFLACLIDQSIVVVKFYWLSPDILAKDLIVTLGSVVYCLVVSKIDFKIDSRDFHCRLED